MRYLNPNKIIAAKILEPYENSGDIWDTCQTRGWQVAFSIEHFGDYSEYHEVDVESKDVGIALIESFGLKPI